MHGQPKMNIDVKERTNYIILLKGNKMRGNPWTKKELLLLFF